MNDILAIVEDHFGECPVAIGHINTLTKDTNMNLAVLILIIQAINDNKKFIEKSKIDIIKNLLNCLIGKFNEYFPKIETQYENKAFVVKFLREKHLESLRKALLKLEGSDGKEEDK